jgi:hypothetical protein
MDSENVTQVSQAGNGIHVHQHEHRAPAVGATKKTSLEVLGIPGEKLPLACKKIGYVPTPLPGGDIYVVVADFLDAARKAAAPKTQIKTVRPAKEPESPDAAALRRAGLSVVPGKAASR